MEQTKINNLKRTIVTAFCTALCVVLPLAFHSIPNAGIVFSPIHFPVFVAGLTVGPYYGALCGLLGPIFAFLFTGMPSSAVLLPIAIECALYGLISGLMMNVFKSGHLYLDLYLSLFTSMLISRLISGVLKALIFSKGTYTFNAFLMSYFVTSLPAIFLQLAIIPSIIVALESSSLIPKRYEKNKEEKVKVEVNERKEN